jgi:hypothetical protein
VRRLNSNIHSSQVLKGLDRCREGVQPLDTFPDCRDRFIPTEYSVIQWLAAI